MAVSKKHIAEAEWMSLKKALDVYGPKELKQRVHAGSIQTRSSPSDSRFPEFKVLTEKDSVTVERTKQFQATSGGKISIDQWKRLSS